MLGCLSEQCIQSQQVWCRNVNSEFFKQGWVDIMYAVQDVYSEWSIIFFVLVVFLGPIFTIQLFLVVITSKFNEVKEHLKKEAREADENLAVEKCRETTKEIPLEKVHIRIFLNQEIAWFKS